MSLLHPTTGDLLDRLCVLALKLGKSPHFADEVEEIEKALANREIKGLHVIQLAMIHLHLWNLTEDQQAFIVGHETDWKGAEILVSLRRCNEERYKLREEIDRESREFKGAEKVKS